MIDKYSMVYDFFFKGNYVAVHFFDKTVEKVNLSEIDECNSKIEINQGIYSSTIKINKKSIRHIYQNSFFVFKNKNIKSGTLALISTVYDIRVLLLIRSYDEIYKLTKNGWKKITLNAKSVIKSTYFNYKNRSNLYQYSNKNHDLLFFIHGGPRDYINFGVNEFTDYFLKQHYDILTINYPVNWEDEQPKIGGMLDVHYVNQIISFFLNSQSKVFNRIFVFGESYGGYLASLVQSEKVNTIISLTGFIDINYEKLVSSERKLINDYLSEQATDFSSNNVSERINYYFFFGDKDLRVPKGQLALLRKHENINAKVLKMNHYLATYKELNMFYKELSLIIRKENLNAH